MNKRIKYLLQLFDGIWSLPISFTLFIVAGPLLQSVGGQGAGTYDIGFIQPLFLAIAIVIGATNAAGWGLFFTLRGFHRYLYGNRVPDIDSPGNTKIINFSKIDWKKLQPCTRFAISLLCYAYFISAILIVYLSLV